MARPVRGQARPILTGMADEIATTYDVFGWHWAHGTSPLYEEWAVGISTDPVVLDLLRPLPRPKRQPNLVFASARWHGCPLAPYLTWRDWLLTRWADVVGTIMTRTVQTNEVTRCATLMPGRLVVQRVTGHLAPGGRPAAYRNRHHTPVHPEHRPRGRRTHRPARSDLRDSAADRTPLNRSPTQPIAAGGYGSSRLRSPRLCEHRSSTWIKPAVFTVRSFPSN